MDDEHACSGHSLAHAHCHSTARAHVAFGSSALSSAPPRTLPHAPCICRGLTDWPANVGERSAGNIVACCEHECAASEQRMDVRRYRCSCMHAPCRLPAAPSCDGSDPACPRLGQGLRPRAQDGDTAGSFHSLQRTYSTYVG